MTQKQAKMALILYLTFQFVFEEREFVSTLPSANVGVGAAGAGVLLNMARVSVVIYCGVSISIPTSAIRDLSQSGPDLPLNASCVTCE